MDLLKGSLGCLDLNLKIPHKITVCPQRGKKPPKPDNSMSTSLPSLWGHLSHLSRVPLAALPASATHPDGHGASPKGAPPAFHHPLPHQTRALENVCFVFQVLFLSDHKHHVHSLLIT